MLVLAIYLALGAVAGVMAGLLGVGGGLVIVPALAWLLALEGVGGDKLMHLAIGTSLATIVITSLASVRAHHGHAAVDWSVFRSLTPGIVLGAWGGAVLATALPSDALRGVFGGFALLVAAQIGFGARPAPHRALPGGPGMAVAGGVIGAVSAVVGIGGGSLTVPFLMWCNTPIRNAVATSSACGLPIAVAGAAGFVYQGWNLPELPAAAVGYVYLPALAGIAAASMLTARHGARWAHQLPIAVLKRVFAAFLALVGVKMLIG